MINASMFHLIWILLLDSFIEICVHSFLEKNFERLIPYLRLILSNVSIQEYKMGKDELLKIKAEAKKLLEEQKSKAIELSLTKFYVPDNLPSIYYYPIIYVTEPLLTLFLEENSSAKEDIIRIVKLYYSIRWDFLLKDRKMLLKGAFHDENKKKELDLLLFNTLGGDYHREKNNYRMFANEFEKYGKELKHLQEEFKFFNKNYKGLRKQVIVDNHLLDYEKEAAEFYLL